MIHRGLRVVAALLLPMLAMPTWVGAAALATSPFEPPQRSASAVLMRALGVADTVERFEGSFYGVSASVALNLNTRVAHVSLRGYPIAGTVEGDGWLKEPDKERGAVERRPLDTDKAAREARLKGGLKHDRAALSVSNGRRSTATSTPSPCTPRCP